MPSHPLLYVDIDGAYFGTTFPHLFFLTFPELKVPKTKEVYIPRVFGFRVNKVTRRDRGGEGRGGRSCSCSACVAVSCDVCGVVLVCHVSHVVMSCPMSRTERLQEIVRGPQEAEHVQG